MKKIFIFYFLFFICSLGCSAQTPKSVLDKCASLVAAKKGAQASFQVAGKKLGNQSGTISIKGNKFAARTGTATVWFDGKTQWTYLKKTNEVNVTTPTKAQQAQMNPLTFINMYKKGYTMTMQTVDGNYEVHLVAQNKQQGIQEAYIVINPQTYVPQQVRMRQKQNWTTVNISNFKATPQADGVFQFNKTDFPTAQIVDLR